MRRWKLERFEGYPAHGKSHEAGCVGDEGTWQPGRGRTKVPGQEEWVGGGAVEIPAPWEITMALDPIQEKSSRSVPPAHRLVCGSFG